MKKGVTYAVLAVVCASCLIYLVTTIIALNCVAQKKDDCARASGLTAGVFGCLLLSGIVAVFYTGKGQGGSHI